MSFELTVYTDYLKHHRLDVLEIMPDIIEGGRVFGRVDDSIVFDRIQDISRLVKHLLLNTNYFFDIRRIDIPVRGYFTKY